MQFPELLLNIYKTNSAFYKLYTYHLKYSGDCDGFANFQNLLMVLV